MNSERGILDAIVEVRKQFLMANEGRPDTLLLGKGHVLALMEWFDHERAVNALLSANSRLPLKPTVEQFLAECHQIYGMEIKMDNPTRGEMEAIRTNL